jgi:hypothetical protein
VTPVADTHEVGMPENMGAYVLGTMTAIASGRLG